MKYVIVKDRPESEGRRLAGFDQWIEVMDAHVLSPEEVKRECPDASFDVVHFLLDDHKIQETLHTVSFLRAHSPSTFAILSLESPLPGKYGEQYASLFRHFDLMLCCNDEIYSVCKSYAPEGCMVKVETAPVDMAKYQQMLQPVGVRPLLTVLGTKYSWRKLNSYFGPSLIKTLSQQYKICIASGNISDDKLAEQIRESQYVLAPEPLYDGGRIVTMCALSRTMLCAHPCVDEAKRVFPFTMLDPENPRMIHNFFEWMYHAPDYAQSFLDNAFHSVLNLNHANKRAQLLNLIRYKRVLPAALNKDPGNGTLPVDLCLEDAIRPVKGSESITYKKNEFIVVCLLKDGEEHLPSFLKHYRRLGCRHFVFIDNGSADNTLAILHQQPDVTLYVTDLPHKYFELEIRRIIVERFCRNRWCMLVDIDELFDYPFSDKLNMQRLLEYLSQHRYTAMVAHMLEMYNTEPVPAEKSNALQLMKDYPCYDISGIKRTPYFYWSTIVYSRNNSLANPDMCCFWGGIRKQIFMYPHDNVLIKHPLIFLDGNLDPVTNAHFSDKARVADITGVLYHYKFVPSFVEKVKKSHAERNYVKFAQDEYDAYYASMHDGISFKINTPSTRRLYHVNELLDNHFLMVSPAFMQLVNEHGRKQIQVVRSRSRFNP